MTQMFPFGRHENDWSNLMVLKKMLVTDLWEKVSLDGLEFDAANDKQGIWGTTAESKA